MNRFIEAIANHPVRSALTAATAPAVALAINCGGGDNSKPTPDDLKSPTANVLVTESPMPSATDMATQVIESPTPVITEAPTIAPTLEPTTIPEPTNIISPLDLITKNISFFENSSAPPGINQDGWRLSLINVLEGSEDQGGNYGLYDIKLSIEKGDFTRANEMISSDLFNKVALFSGLEDTVILNRDEIDSLDPDHLLIPSESVFFAMTAYTRDAAIDLIMAKYAIQ